MSCESANSFFSADGLISATTPSHYTGGTADGFFCCTETLGSESSNDIDESDGYSYNNNPTRKRTRERSTATEERREVKFPPPLTSLSRYGWPSFVLRPVRRDGRLELTEVKIHRPDVLCASRENGRLTIHLVRDVDDQEEEARSEEAGEVENEVEEEGESGSGGEDRRRSVAVGGEGGGEEGIRRCYHQYEGAGKSLHNHLEAWRSRCVTIV